MTSGSRLMSLLSLQNNIIFSWLSSSLFSVLGVPCAPAPLQSQSRCTEGRVRGLHRDTDSCLPGDWISQWVSWGLPFPQPLKNPVPTLATRALLLASSVPAMLGTAGCPRRCFCISVSCCLFNVHIRGARTTWSEVACSSSAWNPGFSLPSCL